MTKKQFYCGQCGNQLPEPGNICRICSTGAPLTSKEKVAVLRTHADICKGAVEVRIERQALKDHAAIFDGAADEIERLQCEVARLREFEWMYKELQK